MLPPRARCWGPPPPPPPNGDFAAPAPATLGHVSRALGRNNQSILGLNRVKTVQLQRKRAEEEEEEEKINMMPMKLALGALVGLVLVAGKCFARQMASVWGKNETSDY